MKQQVNFTIGVIAVISALCLWWMCCAYQNTYNIHVVKPGINSKKHYAEQHCHKRRCHIDTTYIMNVTSKMYGTTTLHVDDITYYNHAVGDTLFFEWTNHQLSRFDDKYDKGLLMHFFVSVCISIMFWCVAYYPLKACAHYYNKEL